MGTCKCAGLSWLIPSVQTFTQLGDLEQALKGTTVHEHVHVLEKGEERSAERNEVMGVLEAVAGVH